MLVKYTYWGDADLSGVIDTTDYFLIDSGFLAGASDWLFGDFDYSNVIDTTDYFLIDNAFLNQWGPLGDGPSPVPEPSAWVLLVAAALSVLGWRRLRRRAS